MRTVLYWLKKRYSKPMVFVHVLSETVDVNTGTKAVTDERYTVRRGVYLPVEVAQAFAAEARGTNFSYAAIYDRERAVILIDKRDLPKDHILEVDDIILTDDAKYKIVSLTKLDKIKAIEFVVTQVKGGD